MSIPEEPAKADVIALRPFVPASEFETSLRFYTDLGFRAVRLGENLASMQIGLFGFLLQGFSAEGFANNYMMHLLVKDLDAWWTEIVALDLAARYGVEPPRAPELQPWGMKVAYVFDPSGVLWHFAEQRTDSPLS